MILARAICAHTAILTTAYQESGSFDIKNNSKVSFSMYQNCENARLKLVTSRPSLFVISSNSIGKRDSSIINIVEALCCRTT